MARSNYIQSVIDASGEERLSTDWYREKIKEFGTPSSLDLIRDGKRSTNPFFGRMNMFVYGPKHKKTLPYYDTFPLVLPLERYSDGFLGINFHYLPIPLRIGLLNELARYASSDAFDENTMLNVTYDAVKKIGFRKTNDQKNTDCFVLNTCHIRDKAKEKVYHEIGRLKKIYRQKNKPIVVVAGCVAQAENQEMLKREPYIDMVI